MSKDSNINFNSIKVRLELHNFVHPRFHGLFQFHKGAIRTYEDTQSAPNKLISIP